jgi:hypothetical protein
MNKNCTVDDTVFAKPIDNEPTQRIQCTGIYGGSHFIARTIESVD